MLARERHDIAVAGLQQRVFAAVAAIPDRPDRVDDVASGETVALCQACLAGRATADLAAFLDELGSGGAVDGAIDAAAAKQAFIGGVDDGGDVNTCDVAFLRAQAAVAAHSPPKLRWRTVRPSTSTRALAIMA